MLKRKSSLHITNIVSSKHMYVITEKNMYCYQRYQGQSMDLVKHTSHEFPSSFKYLMVHLQSFPSFFIYESLTYEYIVGFIKISYFIHV
jgi:hypothetical protein